MIKHRGPDSRGQWISSKSCVGPLHFFPFLQALGHVRLEINDLSPTGAQPLHNTDQTVHAVVNGELYDYDRLRNEMIDQQEYDFKGTSDCELVLALYKFYGLFFLSRLRGEFSLALYYTERQLFIAVRDRYGIKPLFWTVQDGQLLVAAEMKAFLPLGWKPEWDMRSIMDGGYQIGSATFFKNVQKVRPGHYLACRSYGNVEENTYWDSTYPDKNVEDPRTEQEMIEGVRTRLYDSIRERLRADVKVGVALSGGIDSSVVAGMVCQMLKEGEKIGGDKVTDRVTCFGIAFDEDSGFDESDTANRTADFLGVKFYKKYMDEKALADRFEDATWICEPPCPDLNFIGCYALSELVHEKGFHVLLNGQGADETLARYPLFLPKYLREPDHSLFQHDVPGPLLQDLAINADKTGLTYDPGPYHSLTLRQLNSSPSACRISSAYPLHPYTKALLCQFPNPDPALSFVETLSPAILSKIQSTWHPLHSTLYLFTKSNLPTLLLSNFGDRGEMVHSIEGRTPFLDHHLTEYVNGLPPSVKIRPVPKSKPKPSESSSTTTTTTILAFDFVEKYILREAARPFVTSEIYAKRKHPYSALVRWPIGGPLHRLLCRLVTRERVEKLGWIEWAVAAAPARAPDRDNDNDGLQKNLGQTSNLGDELIRNAFEHGDKHSWALLLMVAQGTVLAERFGVATWTPPRMYATAEVVRQGGD